MANPVAVSFKTAARPDHDHGRMHVLFVSSVAVVSPEPAADHRLFVEALGLPLSGQDDYVYTEALAGVKHLGVWPLREAAQACFGTDTWPDSHPVPQASIEFDVDDVERAARELQERGFRLLHAARTEPWGQTVARLQAPAGPIVGVAYTPSMREGTPSA
jgi:hypothetical protein